MDYRKIGEFIATERKGLKLTQAKLAEKLCISEKTVSKWENGNGIPDTDTLPLICEVFGISINELLSGERLSNEEYERKAEEKLLKLQQEKEYAHKTMLTMEIVIGVLSTMILFIGVFLGALLPLAGWLRVVLILSGFAVALVGYSFALKIEQVAGFYECKKCGHKHEPSYKQVMGAMHMGRTRYMKCPHCNQRSWQKKVIK